MVAQQVAESSSGNSREDPVETTKSLICALNYISRNLPLPPHLFAAVSSIYHGASPSLSPPPPSPPRLFRLEEEEKSLIETAKRKFFAEVLNAVCEFQLQIQATQKRRRQRNDSVQAWHGRQRQRAEKLRLMALKSDDQEAYMKLVKESKNERLTTLLEETNKLLANLGAAVQRQKDAKLPEGIDLLKDSESDLSELDAPRSEPLIIFVSQLCSLFPMVISICGINDNSAIF